MTEDDAINRMEYTYGSGYVDALRNVAADLHTQAHVQFDTHGSQDARGLAFFETYKLLELNAANIQADIENRYDPSLEYDDPESGE